MQKSVYMAGKIDTGEGSISEFASELENRRHNVIEKWWELGRLPKPYLDYPETSTPAAKAMVDAAFVSDVFILFPEDNILGAAVEFGAAIASSYDNQNKLVVVVNPFDVRQSVFYAHPAVIAVKGLQQVRSMRWY